MSIQLDIYTEAVRRCLEYGPLNPSLRFNGAQQATFESKMVFLKSDAQDKNRSYGDIATGLGKTGITASIVGHSFNIAQELGIAEDFKILWKEPTITLMDQVGGMDPEGGSNHTGGELLKFAPNLQDAFGFYGGGMKDLGRPVTIMSFHARTNLHTSGELNEFNIYQEHDDEAHHGLSEARQDLINDSNPDTVYFGLSASTQYDKYKTLQRTHRNLIYKMPLPGSRQRARPACRT